MTTNLETWFFVNSASSVGSYAQALDMLNGMPLGTRNKSMEVTTQGNLYIPLAISDYSIVIGTRVFTLSSGTFSLKVLATSSQTFTVYIQSMGSSTVSTYTVPNASSSPQTLSLSLASYTEYAIVIIQNNSNVNNTVFLQTAYSGTRMPKTKAYPSNGSGTIVSVASTVSVGDYKMSALTTDFDGWLLCDGRAISRVAYYALFQAIGTSFGTGDGEYTFNIPDGRGRVPGIVGHGIGLTMRTTGQAIGTETHTLLPSEMPSHTHAASTGTDGSHTHSITDPGHTHTQTTTNDDFNNSGTNPPGFTADSAGSMTWNNINSATTGITISSSGNHTHTVNVSSAGGGAAHNIIQPTLFMGNMFICCQV